VVKRKHNHPARLINCSLTTTTTTAIYLAGAVREP